MSPDIGLKLYYTINLSIYKHSPNKNYHIYNYVTV